MCASKLRTSGVSNELICLRRNVIGPKWTMHAVKERLISHDMGSVHIPFTIALASTRTSFEMLVAVHSGQKESVL